MQKTFERLWRALRAFQGRFCLERNPHAHQRICSWCGRTLEPKECKDPCAGKLVNPVTHTICEECFYKAMDDISSAPAENHNPNEKPKGN
jgi:hypothetical protein